MELRNIRTFIYVAEQKSFSKAANLLGYAQSTVTTQIQQLEQEFDALLFERIHKTVRLTAAGEELLRHANALMRAAEDTRIGMQHLPVESGQIRIGMADSICNSFFTDILERYHMKYPQVEICLKTAGTGELYEMLTDNTADMIYTLDHRIYASDLVTAMEQKTEVLFVTTPDYLDTSSPIPLKELIKENFLLTEKGMSYRKHLDEYLAIQSLELVPFLEMGNVQLLSSLIERGLGISFLPAYAVEDGLQRGTLVKIEVPEERFFVWQQLIYHKNKWLTPPMQAMIDLICQYSEG